MERENDTKGGQSRLFLLIIPRLYNVWSQPGGIYRVPIRRRILYRFALDNYESVQTLEWIEVMEG